MLGQMVTTETSPNNPLSWVVYGEAVVSAGLRVRAAVSGPSVLTRGLACPAWDIWLDVLAIDGIATGWTAALGYTGSASVITTTWSPSVYGVYGEALP